MDTTQTIAHIFVTTKLSCKTRYSMNAHETYPQAVRHTDHSCWLVVDTGKHKHTSQILKELHGHLDDKYIAH